VLIVAICSEGVRRRQRSQANAAKGGAVKFLQSCKEDFCRLGEGAGGGLTGQTHYLFKGCRRRPMLVEIQFGQPCGLRA